MHFSPNDSHANSFVHLVKHNDARQAVYERLLPYERPKQNAQTFVQKYFDESNPSTSSSINSVDLQFDKIESISLNHHATPIFDFNEINSKIQIETQFFELIDDLSNNFTLFIQDQEKISNEIIIYASNLVDTKNPTLLLFLLSFAGFIFIRTETEGIKFYSIKKLFTYFFFILIIFSAVSIPVSIGSSYWGYAFAEEISNSTETVEGESVPPCLVNHLMNLQHFLIPLKASLKLVKLKIT